MLNRSGVNQGAAPVTYGQGERAPRGDYASAASDYTCDQNWSAYSAQEHELYRRLYERQASQLAGLACDEFIAADSERGGLYAWRSGGTGKRGEVERFGDCGRG